MSSRFSSASRIEEIVWAMKMADFPRGSNRARIDKLFNGNPPYSDAEARKNNISTNVNFLESTQIAHNARRQFSNAFLKPGNFFNVRLDSGPIHKRDEWGNIITGIDLGRRMGTPQLYALTAPLLTTASGAKMGKTAAGAVWLNADMLSPYGYWQFWRNTEDGDVGRFLKLFTELPMDEIARLEALGGAQINEAKKVLANEATAMVHGREAAEAAAETARKTFEEGVVAGGGVNTR